MPKFLTVKDTAAPKGMNSVDNPKILTDGYCEELVNGFPGFPPRIRNGCSGVPIPELAGYELVSEPFYAVYKNNRVETERLFFWARSSDEHSSYYHLFVYYLESRICTRLDSARLFTETPDNKLKFSFVRIKDIVYTVVDMFGYGGNGYMFAIEHIPNFTRDTFYVRQVGNSQTEFGLQKVNTPSGAFKDCFTFGYSVTLVRRSGNFSPTEPITTYAPGFVESIENVSHRSYIMETNPAVEANISINLRADRFYNFYGYTHFRVYRTRDLHNVFSNDENTDNTDKSIAGATRFFLADVPIPENLQAVFIDDITDGALSGEMNQLTSFNYTLPPTDAHKTLYHKNRLWLLGRNGKAYFSEITGGDGGGDLEYSYEETDKFSLWFRPLYYRVDLAPEDGGEATAIAALGDDLFFFKEHTVWMIINGEPTQAPLTKVSDTIGCPYPDTLINVKIQNEKALFFLSNRGPMLITEGGHVQPFNNFKVRELWPELNSELFKDKPYSCSAAFWRDTIWLIYKTTKESDCKIFAYYSGNDAAGAFEVRFANLYPTGSKVLDISHLTPLNENKAVSIDNMNQSRGALVDFLANSATTDSLAYAGGGSGGGSFNFHLVSRRLYPGPMERSLSELFRAVGYCEFFEDPVNGSPFTLEIKSERHKVKHGYYYENELVSNQFGTPISGSTHRTAFAPNTPVPYWNGGLAGSLAKLYFADDEEGTAQYLNIRSITTGALIFDRSVGGLGDTVKIIGRPKVRTHIEFIPQADFAGSYFQYTVEKVLREGGFKWFGIEFQSLPRPALESEEVAGGMPVSHIWE